MASHISHSDLERSFTHPVSVTSNNLELEPDSRVAVLGSGPAGSFFTYFLLDIAHRASIHLNVDMFERKSFTTFGPAGCNMCGGIISESLVQSLATEGINLPPTVVERAIDSYVLHMDVGTVSIATPLQEKRIASVHRGAGPKGAQEVKWQSFDHHLQRLALDKGANLVQGRVDEVTLVDGKPHIKVKDGPEQTYDLLAVAAGVNTGVLKLFESLPIKYTQPTTTGTYICEFFLGVEKIEQYLGSSMHVFLLNIPRLEFAALVPKGEYVTLCLLGRDIDDELVQAFLASAEVRSCFPADWQIPKTFCHCSPRISISASPKPYADRIVFIGDCGATRLYKDGIGAAYRTAKSAASTAILQGISAASFQKYFRPVCQDIEWDNTLGKLIFLVTREIQRRAFERRGVLRMVSREQRDIHSPRRMSSVLWDTFTGSAPYRDILLRTLHPAFLAGFGWDILAGLVRSGRNGRHNGSQTTQPQ